MSWIPRPRVYSKVHSRFTHDSHICYNWKKYAILRMCSYAGTSPSQGGNHGNRWHWADFGSEWEPAKRLAEQTNMIQYGSSLLMLRANTSICPRLSAAIFVCAENVIKMRVFCIMVNFMLYIGTHSIGTCASLLHIIIIIIIIPLLKIFNECRSLAGVGELNPYWRSSMNVEV